MIKYLRTLLLILVCCGLLAAVKAEDSLSNKARVILQNKCFDCHSSKAELPPYGNIPFVKDLIKKDIEEGVADWDMETDLKGLKDKDLSERSLLKLEMVVTDKTMPPIQYTVIHWDKILSLQERQTILAWLKTLEN